QQIVGITDLNSAGVALLRDIKTMFDRSTLDYLTSKAIIDDLTSDPEKAWAEWSRGKPITEKGVATLLHEYWIASRTVGPKGATAKGYRKADFEDAWKRYASPEEARPSGLEFLPSTRRPDGYHYDFGETSAVDMGSGRQEKNEYSPNDISAVDGS